MDNDRNIIKEYRIAKGFTQEQFAEAIDKSHRQYQRIESDLNCISIVLLKKIIKVLEISDEDILILMKK